MKLKNELTDHDHDKFITIPEFNNLAAAVFDIRLKRASLVAKTDFDDKLKILNQKINSNKTKNLLVENALKKLKTFDSIYFRDESHFKEDGTQNYLVFQPMYRYFKRVIGVGSGDCIYFWKSKGLSDKNITALNTSDYSLNPQLSYFGTKTRMKFKGSCLKQDNYNTYIVYEINNNNNNCPALKICLFCAASLPKKADIDKYKCFGYGIGFDGHLIHIKVEEMQ